MLKVNGTVTAIEDIDDILHLKVTVNCYNTLDHTLIIMKDDAHKIVVGERVELTVEALKEE